MTDSKPTPKPSKSERKREAQALQELGEQLISLNDDQIAGLDLEERLRDAIDELRRMKSREAVRRHKQYIGKLMKDVDPAPIRALLDESRADERRAKRVFAVAERWRDRLIAEGQSALEAFEEETGTEQPAVGELLAELDRAFGDRAEKTIKRNLFRRVHEALVAAATDG